MSESAEPDAMPPRRLTHWSVWGAGLIAGGAFLLPPSGTGFDICMFKNWLDLPCPACGLTRSVTNLGHGDLGASMQYHPFGILVLVIAASCLVVNFGLTAKRRQILLRWMVDRRRPLRRVYMTLLWLFFGYGMVRIGLLLGGWWPGPVVW